MGLISRVSSRTYRQLWAGSVPVPKKKKKPKNQTPVVATQRSPAVVIQLSRQRPHNSLHQIPINSNSRHSNTVFRPSNSNLAHHNSRQPITNTNQRINNHPTRI